MSKVLVGLLLLSLPICQAYMYLTGAGVGDDLSTLSLRGDKPGNIWNPPKKGGNRIPCGGKGNSKTVLEDEERLTVSTGASLRIVGKLTLPEDDEYINAKNPFEQPWVDVQIKYGPRPNFQMTQGYSLGVWAPKETGFYQLVREIPEDALNEHATLQVSYHVADTPADITFYQCIDLIIEGGEKFPEGDYPWGVGPDDTTFNVPICLGGNCGVQPDDDGPSGFQVALIILLILIAIVVVIFIYCFMTKKAPQPEDTPIPSEPLQVEEAPKEPEKPATPPVATPPKEDSDNEPVGHVMYTPAEDSDPTPQESSEQKSLDATGSQGRHFHFRYVEEDDDDGNKEDVV